MTQILSFVLLHELEGFDFLYASLVMTTPCHN